MINHACIHVEIPAHVYIYGRRTYRRDRDTLCCTASTMSRTAGIGEENALSVGNLIGIEVGNDISRRAHSRSWKSVFASCIE
jgi:hypothetical protein